VKEVAVPRLYLDPKRAFGGILNDEEARLAYYRRILSDAEFDWLPGTPSVCSLLGCEPDGVCP
jgi:hypothetical protein